MSQMKNYSVSPFYTLVLLIYTLLMIIVIGVNLSSIKVLTSCVVDTQHEDGLREDALKSVDHTDKNLYKHIHRSRSDEPEVKQNLNKNRQDNLIGILADNRTSCTPIYNIYYAKVHKAGSTTISTMFDRLALRHDVNIYLVEGSQDTNARFHTREFLPPQGVERKQPNMFFYHQHFNHQDAAKIMQPDTHYIGSVRFPLTQLASLVVEFQWYNKLHLNLHGDFVGQLIENLEMILQLPEAQSDRPYILGSTATDLGLYNSHNKTFATEHLDELAKLFEFMTVTEYFKESLILMRRAFCWQMKDIVYTVQRKRNIFKYDDHLLPWSLQEKHRKVSLPEYKIYNIFKDRLLNTISQEADFNHEMFTYERVLKKTASFCDVVIDKIRNNQSYVYNCSEDDIGVDVNPAPWGAPFRLHCLDCAVMRMETNVLMNVQKIRQYPELCTSPSITRINRTDVLNFDIVWRDEGRTKLLINPKYCDPPSVVRVPLSVLADITAYMWL